VFETFGQHRLHIMQYTKHLPASRAVKYYNRYFAISL
jgi:hypothetical protein